MSKQSRRPSRRNRPPRSVRYSTSGSARIETHGDGSESLFLSGEAAEPLREYLQWAGPAFEQQFGRPMGPGDPVFWDLEADEPRPADPARLHRDLIGRMRSAGIDEAYIFAYEVTGILLNEENLPLVDPETVELFYTAMEAFDAYGPAIRKEFIV